MASSLTRADATFEMHATVSGMPQGRVWNSATRRSVRIIRDSDGAGPGHTAFGDGVLAVCFFVLVGVAVLGGLLILFSWVTATLPMSQIFACPEFDGCGVSTPDQNQAVGVEDPRINDATMTP